MILSIPDILFGQMLNYFNYDTESGLPSSEVYSVKQTNDGKMWFTSDRGIFSYNGYEFKTYTTNNGLANNTNFDIFENPDGSLWFTGLDGSLTIYNKGKFSSQIEISNFVKKNYINDWIKFVVFDRTKIYFALNKQRKLFCHDIATKRTNGIDWPLGLGDGIITIGNSYFKYIDKERNRELKITSQQYIYPVIKLHDNVFYTVFNKRLLIYKRIDNTFTAIDSLTFNREVHPKNYINFKDEIYLCIDGNILCYNIHSKKVIKKCVNSNISPTGINFDHEYNIWITTLNKGVIMLPDFSVSSMFDSIIGKSKINSIVKYKNTIVAGSNTGSIYIFNKDKPAQSIQLIDGNISIDQIYFLQENDFYAYRNIVKKNNSPFSQNAQNNILMQYSIDYDNGAVIYSKGSNLGLLKNGKSINLKRYTPLTYIRSLALYNNRLWVGTISGLYHFKIVSDSLYDKVSMADLNPVFSNRINNIQNFRDGILISVFGKGLIYLHHSEIQKVEIPSLDPSVLINKIVVYDSNTVLLLTNFGLYKLSFKNSTKLVLSNVGIADLHSGLNSNFINDAEFDNGNIWIATNSGISFMRFEDLNYSRSRPIVNIIGIQTRDSNYLYNKEITLKAHENTFIVKFEGICFRKPDQFPFYRYAWISQKGDTVWNYTNDRNIQLMNVKPGNYTFLLTARSKSGDWATIKELHISLEPNFYQTWWFMLFISALCGIFIWVVFNFRISLIREKEAQRNTVAVYDFRTKEAELKALRNQMNPHFIYNSLNSIQRYMITKDFETANAYITKFSQLIRTGLHMSKLEYISLEKELAFIRNYLDLEQMRFENLFTYTINVDSSIEMELLNIPSLLIQPLLENSIKHGFKHIMYGGHINIELKNIGNEHLEIVLEDNGCGINGIKLNSAKESSNTSMGIDIVRQRIHLLKEKMNDTEMTFELTNIELGVRAKIILPYTA